MINKIMNVKDIERYLSQKNISLDNNVFEAIEELRKAAILEQNEKWANYYWCLKQIFLIQKRFVLAVNNLKNGKYEDAWCIFDQVDIDLGFLEINFDISQENDKFHLFFIGKMIKSYQKLFPYTHFLSRENIIKKEICSICGQPISLRRSCGHKAGKVYMGELCLREVVDMEIQGLCIVTDSFDKYTYLRVDGKEYDYGMLMNLMREIDSPYDEFCVETIKVIMPDFKGVGRNSMCPCGSGKKYKKCHLGTKAELMEHHKIIFPRKKLRGKTGTVGIFNTWK